MKMIKKIIMVLLIVFIAGCSNKEFNQIYDKMQAGTGKDDINGYSIDLRVYGTASKETINEIIRISNYNNKDFRITIVNKDINPIIKPEEEAKPIVNNDTIIYVIDGKTYTDQDGTYKVIDKKQKYTNPLIYLEGLKNVKSTESESEEINGENKYQVYNVLIKENFVKEILDELDLKVNVEKDINAKIYKNQEGYLYRIIYYIDELTVNVNYYGIDNSTKILLP